MKVKRPARLVVKNRYKALARKKVGFGARFVPSMAGRTEPGGVLTLQTDGVTDYRRRPLSKFQRRIKRLRYKRARRLVRTVRNADIGSTHILETDAWNLGVAADLADAASYGLYGLNGTSSSVNACNDMGRIFNKIDPAAWAAVNNPAFVGQNYRIYAQNATAEYTLRNTGSNDAIIEAYFIRGRKPVNNAYAGDPSQSFAAGFAKENVANDPTSGNALGTRMFFTTIGVTPFQSALFCRDFSIYKRQKFRLVPGAEISFVLRDSKPRTFTMDQTRSNSTDRNYHGILFQQFGSPDQTLVPPRLATTSSVTYMCTRRYRIKMFRDNMPLQAIVT